MCLIKKKKKKKTEKKKKNGSYSIYIAFTLAICLPLGRTVFI